MQLYLETQSYPNEPKFKQTVIMSRFMSFHTVQYDLLLPFASIIRITEVWIHGVCLTFSYMCIAFRTNKVEIFAQSQFGMSGYEDRHKVLLFIR